MRRLLLPLTLLALLLGSATAAADAPLATGGVGAKPRSDAAAAKLVRRSTWEPRADNAAANHHAMSASELADFRSRSDMPYKDWVTGRYTGTTDEIIQWAAFKWRIRPDLLRAVATVESWWHMSTTGDGGDSFGLFQIRQPYHCCKAYAQGYTAFNADYYGAIVRALYDGKMPWLNQVPHGSTYKTGDIWGAIGEWASGRWHMGDESYVAQVKQRLAERTWATNRWF